MSSAETPNTYAMLMDDNFWADARATPAPASINVMRDAVAERIPSTSREQYVREAFASYVASPDCYTVQAVEEGRLARLPVGSLFRLVIDSHCNYVPSRARLDRSVRERGFTGTVEAFNTQAHHLLVNPTIQRERAAVWSEVDSDEVDPDPDNASLTVIKRLAVWATISAGKERMMCVPSSTVGFDKGRIITPEAVSAALGVEEAGFFLPGYDINMPYLLNELDTGDVTEYQRVVRTEVFTPLATSY